jgi:hypothetical protein
VGDVHFVGFIGWLLDMVCFCAAKGSIHPRSLTG